MTRIKAMLVTDSTIFAGTERHIADLSQALREQGIDVFIGCPHNSPLHERAQELALPVITAPAFFFALRMTFTLVRMLRKEQINLIHAHNGVTHLSAAIAIALARSGCCIATQHFVTPSRSSRKGIAGVLSPIVHRWLMDRSKFCIAISEAVAAAIRKRGDCPEERLLVIPNGISPPRAILRSPSEVRRTLGIPPDSQLVVAAARLAPEKSLHTLIEAMPFVVDSVPNVRCIIAGEGGERVKLQALIDRLNLQETVQLIGYQKDALSLINACDAFILPSACEPFGLVLLEAMFLGKPVVAANAGGPCEIVQDGVNGLLFQPDCSLDLSRSIIHLLNRDSARDIACHGSITASDRYSASLMGQRTRELYYHALNSITVA